jgi:hypothetical protein
MPVHPQIALWRFRGAVVQEIGVADEGQVEEADQEATIANEEVSADAAEAEPTDC